MHSTPTFPRRRATPNSARAPRTSSANTTPPTREYSYEDWTGQNQGVGGQTLAAAGFNNRYHEDDLKVHVDSTLSPVLLNQASIVGEHDFSHNVNVAEAPRVTVQGNFTSGSAQNDSLSTEYNFRLYDMMTWTHGRHFVKFGAGMPHISRRAFDDNTNALGSYTFGPTLAPDGVTVLTLGARELRGQSSRPATRRIPATCTSSITSRRWARSSRTSSR